MIDDSEGFSGIWLKPVDPRRYGWTRVAFAVVVLCQMIHLWQYRDGLYGRGGLFADDVAEAFSNGVYLPGILMVDVSWWPALMMVCGMLASLLLIWGKWARVSLAVVFLVLLTFVQRAPLATTGWDFVLTNFAFVLLFSPLAGDWSPLRLWASRRAAKLGKLERGMLPRYGLVLLQLQVAVIYWQTVGERLGNKFWAQGEFMSYYLLSNHSRFAGLWVLDWDKVLVPVTYLTSLVELAIPVLLWIKSTRWIGVVLGAFFHISIAVVSLNIGLFSLAMLMSYVVFIGGLPNDDWDDD